MLCPFTRILNDALTDSRAVGAFNIGNMEILIGVVKAAEESCSPVILQIAEKRFSHSPLEYIAPLICAAAARAKVEIALELDHGYTMFNVRRAMDLGFNTVMYDGSAFALEENIKKTQEVVSEAHGRGVAVEAEIGVVGGSEGGEALTANCARFEDITAMGKKSGCDALAVAIGNAHGHYRGVPRLNFDLLLKTHDALPQLPLVLHGGTGIADEDFRRAISMGICKINIATANFDAFARGAVKYAKNLAGTTLSYFDLNEILIAEVYDETLKHLKVFNNKDPL